MIVIVAPQACTDCVDVVKPVILAMLKAIQMSAKG